MPHGAFRGATPDEVLFGRADRGRAGPVAARRKARADRIAHNRELECGQCHGLEPPTVAENGQEAA